METEKIDVPKFDGFECIGVHIPIDTGMDVYVLSMSGKGLLRCPVEVGNSHAQICYRKIKPKRITFESTGEVRTPKFGEYFKSAKRKDLIELAEFDYSSEYEIWRVVEEQS